MKFTFLYLISFLSLHSSAQINRADSISILNAEKQCNIMATLFIEKKYNEFTRFTYPPVVKKFGGEQNMVTTLKKELDKLETQGYTFTNATIEKPLKMIHFNKMLQCSLTENLEIKIPGGNLRATSTLIGISTDNGKNWTFIDTHGSDLASLQKIVPDLSNDLDIPKKTEPVFYKDEKTKTKDSIH
jgi:hypothetical protein